MKIDNFGKEVMTLSYFLENPFQISGLNGKTDSYGNVNNFLGFHCRNLVESGNERPYVLPYKIKLISKYSFLMTPFM